MRLLCLTLPRRAQYVKDGTRYPAANLQYSAPGPPWTKRETPGSHCSTFESACGALRTAQLMQPVNSRGSSTWQGLSILHSNSLSSAPIQERSYQDQALALYCTLGLFSECNASPFQLSHRSLLIVSDRRDGRTWAGRRFLAIAR